MVIKQHPMEILDTLKVSISTTASKEALDGLFSMAARINTQRSFLFVSKVLGKHWPCLPAHMFEKAEALARQYAQSKGLRQCNDGRYLLEKETLFIGFAETATGFAHAVFRHFTGQGVYYHTTRDFIPAKRAVLFQEEHSHATDHFLYLREVDGFSQNTEVVLIDDEFTTGKTVLNIAKELNQKYGVEKFYAMALLDWRGTAHKKQFEEAKREHGLSVEVLSLVCGDIQVDGALESAVRKDVNTTHFSKGQCSVEMMDLRSHFPYRYKEVLERAQGPQVFDYNGLTGRFGLTVEDHENLEKACRNGVEALRKSLKEDRVLFMGFEELIYIPALMAEIYGANARCQSITRSPIYADEQEGYPIQSKVMFTSPKFGTYTNFFYNIQSYDGLVFFFEGDMDNYCLQELMPILKTLPCKKAYCVMV